LRAGPQCRKAAIPLLSWNAKAVWSEAMTGTLRRSMPGGPRHARFLRGGVEDPDRRTASIKARHSFVGRSRNSGLERSDILSNDIGGEAPIAEPPASRQDTALLDEAATAVWSVAT
jgi:hypothetical protein